MLGPLRRLFDDIEGMREELNGGNRAHIYTFPGLRLRSVLFGSKQFQEIIVMDIGRK